MPLTKKGLLLAGIVDALSTMKEIKGSTTKAIVKYIRFNPLPDMSKRGITETTIQKAIKSAVDEKILRQNNGRFLIDFEGMTSLANAAQFSKSGSRALSRLTGPVDRGCKPKKRRRSRGCKKRSRRKSKRGCRSSKKRRGNSCKKLGSRKSKRGCRKSKKRRSRGCKKRSRRRSKRGCRSSRRRRRRSRSCKKRSRRKSGCKKRSRRKSGCKKRSRRRSGCKKSRRPKRRKCRDENEEDDAMAPEAPMPRRQGVRVMKKESTATLLSIPSMTSTATKKSDNSPALNYRRP